MCFGGEGGIRTPGSGKGPLVFKTSLVNHLSTSPYSKYTKKSSNFQQFHKLFLQEDLEKNYL